MKQKWQIHCIVEKQKVTYSCAHVQVMSTLCLQFSKREI
jgi:tRNA uridine 5-carbamoylmethylation protein Kti12